MTSINTNIAAQTALRTLQNTNAQLDATQNRISTGLKIGEAKDNAAYWSISTTLKSDSRSLGTVREALGLGAATVDTAYQGLNAARDVLEEIQNKIILASGDSADKKALQAEIEQLQSQLKAIANSSGFSGENWLAVDSGSANFTTEKSVVSSFNRDASGAVMLDTIKIDIADFALINSSAEVSGILDGGKTGNTRLGGIAGMDTAASGSEVYGAVTTNGIDLTGIANGDTVSFQYRVDGATAFTNVGPVTLTNAGSLTQVAADIQAAMTGVNVTVDPDDATKLVFTSEGTGTSSAVAIQNFEFAGSKIGGTDFGTVSGTAGADASTAGYADTGALTLTSLGTGDRITFNIAVDGGDPAEVTVTLTDGNALSDVVDDFNTALSSYGVTAAVSGTGIRITSSTLGADSIVALSDFAVAGAKTPATNITSDSTTVVAGESLAAEHTFATFTAGGIELDADDTISFRIAVDGAPARTVTIDRATAVAAGFADGVIADADDFATVVTEALSRAGVTGVTASNEGGALKLTSTSLGEGASIRVTDENASRGVNILGLDVSNANEAVLANYRNAVIGALSTITDHAATLGAVASRIELQQSFVSNLMDTIDRGVSGLVDADMNEESTRLQALQVKQQLGVQALAIANQSAQNVLRLFQ